MASDLTQHFDPACDRKSSFPALKGRFPFRLATSSYIIPAAILPNIRFLGQYVDEVELVLFESGREDNLPSGAEVVEMSRLGTDFDITYNVHLPADVFLGDPDRIKRKEFRQTLLRFYERTLTLDPEVFILHLDSRTANREKNSGWGPWTERVREELEALIGEGMDPHRIAVENLEYPLEIILPLVEAFGMSLCLDLGHFIRYGYALIPQMERFLDKSSMIHLHGVRDDVDHLGLERISQWDWEIIGRALTTYTGGVTLEVFSLNDFTSSLHRMEGLLTPKKRP